MAYWRKDAGVWKRGTELWTRDAGVWKQANLAYVRDAGVWKRYLAPLPSISYNTSTSSTTNATTVNYGTLSVGAAATGRVVVVMVHGETNNSNLTVNQVTLNGGAMLEATQRHMNVVACGLFYATMSSGTSYPITATFSTTVQRSGVSVWSLYDLLSATPTHFDHEVMNIVSSGQISLTVPEGGIYIAGSTNSNQNVSHTYTNLTESYDTTIGTDARRAGGWGQRTDPATVTVTDTMTANDVAVIAGAVWR